MPDGAHWSPRPRLPLATICSVVCERYGVTLKQLRGPRRTPSLVWPRWVAWYLCRHRTDASYPAIAKHFGGRDHTSVLHGVRRVGDRMMDDPAVFEEIVALHVQLDTIRSPRIDVAPGQPDPFIAQLVAQGVRRG